MQHRTLVDASERTYLAYCNCGWRGQTHFRRLYADLEAIHHYDYSSQSANKKSYLNRLMQAATHRDAIARKAQNERRNAARTAVARDFGIPVSSTQ